MLALNLIRRAADAVLDHIFTPTREAPAPGGRSSHGQVPQDFDRLLQTAASPRKAVTGPQSGGLHHLLERYQVHDAVGLERLCEQLTQQILQDGPLKLPSGVLMPGPLYLEQDSLGQTYLVDAQSIRYALSPSDPSYQVAQQLQQLKALERLHAFNPHTPLTELALEIPTAPFMSEKHSWQLR